MKNIAGNLAVSLLGILSFALTVAIVVIFDKATGFNLFSMSFWLVIPAGALLCGAAAASGYYFGALWTHTRPSRFIFVQMVIVAALAQLTIYYTEYATFTFDDGTLVSNSIGFWQYLDVYLSSMHMRIGRGGQIDSGEVGSFGYWLAVIQFVGFLLGGIAVFIFLRTYPVCDTCSRYMRKLAFVQKKFNSQDQFADFYDNVFDLPVDGPEFAEAVRPSKEKIKDEEGTVMSEMTLRGCPHCHSQTITEEVKVLRAKEYKEVDKLKRIIRIPDDINLVPVFNR